MAVWEDWFKDCDCSCSCKKFILWALGISTVVALVVVCIIAFAVVYPPKATADDAVLTRFALAEGTPPANSTMSYNITATLSLRNPNMYRDINYDPLAVSFSFNGSRFDDSAAVPAFKHKARKTATFHVTVGGAGKPVKLTAAGVAEFKADNATNIFDVELRLDTVIQYKGRKARCPLVVVCPLKLQLVDPEVAATAFQRDKCTILRAKKSGC